MKIKTKLKKQIKDIRAANYLMRATALREGYNVDLETSKLIDNTDPRVSINLAQRYRIKSLERLLEEEEK